jgi:hypothetical protein
MRVAIEELASLRATVRVGTILDQIVLSTMASPEFQQGYNY